MHLNTQHRDSRIARLRNSIRGPWSSTSTIPRGKFATIVRYLMLLYSFCMVFSDFARCATEQRYLTLPNAIRVVVRGAPPQVERATRNDSCDGTAMTSFASTLLLSLSNDPPYSEEQSGRGPRLQAQRRRNKRNSCAPV